MKRQHKAWAIDNGGKAVFQTSRGVIVAVILFVDWVSG